MKLLDKLKRAKDPRAWAVTADLERLDAVEKGLAKQAARYVLTGDNETVLSTLSTKCQGRELEVGKLHLGWESPGALRRKLLAQASPYDLEFATRYTEVLSCSCKDLPESAAGGDNVTRLVRVFFSEVFDGVRADTRRWPPQLATIDAKGLSLPTALAMTERLGGTVEDFITVLYNESTRYGSITGELYRKAVDVKPLAEKYPAKIIAVGRTLAATARTKLLQELHAFGLAETSDYRDFVLELAGDGSKAVREMAASILSAFDYGALEPKAIARLNKGNVAMRAAMVDLLAKIGTDSALAALRERQDTEKTARIVAAIQAALTAAKQTTAGQTGQDNERQYQAVDGSVVEIPAPKPLREGEVPTFGADDKKTVLTAIREENARLKKSIEDMKRKGYKRYRRDFLKEGLADQALRLFNAQEVPKGEQRAQLNAFLIWGPGKAWARSALSRLPQAQALQMAAAVSNCSSDVLSPWGQGPFLDTLRDFLHSSDGDIRHIERLEIEMRIDRWYRQGADWQSQKILPGDLLRQVIPDDYQYAEHAFDNAPPYALWPYLAEHLGVLDEAFGLKPRNGPKLSRVGALKVLHRLPKPPARFFSQLLEAAAGETKGGRAEARAMLAQAPDVAEHACALLNDSRQAVRASAAEWIAERNDVAALPNLKARLKKEKAAVARAAILTAMDALGEDLSNFVGPKALLDEAQAGLKKTKLDKLDWLGLDHLPKLRYRSNRSVPEEVLKWWLATAVKLKQPGGNALFDIYMARLNPQDAQAFSEWVLDSWYNYDTAGPTEQEAIEYAQLKAAGRYQYMKKWVEGYTKERAYAELKRECLSTYLNSGAATKGLLALCQHAQPALAADRVRTYLKQHGSRTSQASALLELLASMGDPVTLQVVIAAATRLKQKGVQNFAGTLVEKVAKAKSWTMDELADRTVPSAGLDEDGVLQLPCGPDEKQYSATIGDALTLQIRNPDGNVIKALPSASDDVTKASKKQLSASRRELKQVVAMQSARLYEALCSERQWAVADWRRDIAEHPVMSRLAERAVWLGQNQDGGQAGLFRPTAEGDYTSAEDEDVDIDAFATIRLAHGALISASEASAWQGHLKDYEVKPVFAQFGRELLKLDATKATATTIDDRKGWVTDTFTIRGVASKLGYERGEALDGGYFNEYIKGFQSAGLRAVIEFSGNCLPEENVPAALITLSFERDASGRRTGGTVTLKDVPPVLLSECWNDYRDMVAKGAFDEDWEKKMPW